jgi:hypothetical protein
MSRSNISSRLEKLESFARSGPSRRCLACGLPPHGPRRIVTVEGDPEHDPQERCSECGRFLWTTIFIVYEHSEGSDAAS